MTTNKINGMRYIDKTLKPEHHQYLGSGKYLKRAIKKYGKGNFERIILERCENEQQLLEREEYWIAHYKANTDNSFYNISAYAHGGHHGRDYSGCKNPMFGKKHPNHIPHFGENNGMYGSKRTLSKNPNAKPVIIEDPYGKIYKGGCAKEICFEIFGNDKNYTKIIYMIRQYEKGIVPRKGSTFYKWKGKYDK